MLKEYRISIPLKTMVRSGLQYSSGYGLPDKCAVNGIFTTRLIGLIPYLDFIASADNREEAITSVLPNVYFFIQLLALVNNMSFEIDMPNIKASRTDDSIEPSDYLYMQPAPANLDELIYIWKQFEQVQGSKKGNIIKKGIEWVYLGNTMIDDRNALIAYTTALELLLEYKEDEKGNTTVYKKYAIENATLKKMQKEIHAVLQKYIENEVDRERVMTRMRDTELESRKKRWMIKLKKAELEVSEEEINRLYDTRSSTSHSGKGIEIPVSRVYEIVSKYLKALLKQD